MDPKNRIIFALDLPSLEDAKPYIDLLKNEVGIFKVGLELYIKEGKKIIDYINNETKNEIFLDLKLLDIPKTIERSVGVVKDLGVRFLTVHAHDKKTLEAALKGANGCVDILGVTVLTSLDSETLKDQGIKEDLYTFPKNLVKKRVKHAYESGCAGVICSPKESGVVKDITDKDFLAITPGIRMSHNDMGDQKRVLDPFTAIKNGSDCIVVGRPIKEADDPVKAAKEIAFEIEKGLQKI